MLLARTPKLSCVEVPSSSLRGHVLPVKEETTLGCRGASARSCMSSSFCYGFLPRCCCAVTRVRFSRHRPEIFAYAAADGTLRICHTGPCQGPPRAVLESSGSHHSPLPRAKDTTGSGASSPAKAQGLSRSTSTTGTPRHSSGSNSSSSGGAGAKASPQAGGVGSLAQARSPSQGSGLSASGTPPSPSPTVPAASPASSKASSPSQGAQAHPGRAEDAGRRPRRASKGPQTPRVMHELKGHTKEVTGTSQALGVALRKSHARSCSLGSRCPGLPLLRCLPPCLLRRLPCCQDRLRGPCCASLAS